MNLPFGLTFDLAAGLVPLPVLLPLLGTGATLMLAKHPRAQRAVSVAVLAAVAVVAAVLLVVVDREGPLVTWLGAWRGLGIALVADRLAALMLLVSALVTLAVLVYSLGQRADGDDRDAPVSVYYPTFLTLVAGVANAFLAGDLFNLFVSFEMLLFASYVLLTLGGSGSRVRAGTIYVVVNAVSSALFLLALATTYAATGTLNLAQLAVRLDDLPDATATAIQLMLLVTFAIKAAVFPLSLWLPDSYPTAPAPVTAVFAGLLTKVGVYAIIRTQTLLFPDQPLSGLLLGAALATMVVGILGAIAQSDIKRLLSFTLVSHIGYMIFGVGLATSAGLQGAVFYVAHHITIQTALFLVVGLMEWQAGSTARMRLGGMARLFPAIAVLFFVSAMNLAGIPPFSGFVGKVSLLEAGLQEGSALGLVLVAGGTLTSLLTLYAVAKTWALVFWRTPAEAHEMSAQVLEPAGEEAPLRHRGHVHLGDVTLSTADVEEFAAVVDPEVDDRDLHQLLEDDDVPSRPPPVMFAATSGLVVLSLALSVLAGPLVAYTDRAATDLAARSPYLDAVADAAEDPS